MEINCEKSKFLKAINLVQKAVDNKGLIPIISGIKFDASIEKGLILTATDLEITIRAKADVEVVEEGSLVLPARYLVELFKRLPESMITIESNKFGGAVIRYGKSESVINGFSSNEFPEFPAIESVHSFKVNGDNLKTAIKKVVFACSTNESRPIFTGVFFEIEDTLNLVATDTHRLAYHGIPLSYLSGKKNFIVPSKTVNEVSKIVDGDHEVNVMIAENQVMFEFADGTTMVSRLLEGDFPNYRGIIPTEFQNTFSVKTQDFVESVDRAMLLTTQGTSITKLFLNGKLTIEAKNETGKVHEELEADTEGDDTTIVFNTKYLSEHLKAINNEKVKMQLTGSLSPAMLTPVNDDSYFSIILPLRLPGE